MNISFTISVKLSIQVSNGFLWMRYYSDKLEARR